VVSLLIVLVVYSFAAGKSRVGLSYQKLLTALAVLIVVIAGAITWVQNAPAGQNKAAEKRQEITAILHGATDPGGTTEQRLEFYGSAISAFCQKPLTGWGLGGWPVFYYGYEKPDYPHNIVLEIAAEQGFLGLLALFSFLGAICVASRRIWVSGSDFAFPLPLFAFSFLACMFSSDLNARTLWFWAGTIFAISRMCAPRLLARFYSEPVLQPA
jgi:O-antigen ligase